MTTTLLLAFYFLLSPTGSAKAQGKVLLVGSKAFTESVILGDMVVRLVKASGGQAVHKSGLGGTQILWQGLLRGDIDVYPDYTGTLYNEQFYGKGLTTLGQLESELAKLGLGVTQPLGFNNSYAIGMRREKAKKLGITRISQLKNFPNLRFGFSQEFMTRTEGWPALRAKYTLPQQDIRSMEHQLAYRALADDAVDVKDFFSTDAEIELYDLVSLEDDLELFPEYQALYVYRLDAEKKVPGLGDLLAKLSDQIDDQKMIELNAMTKVKKIQERKVARAFIDEEILQKPSIGSAGANSLSSLKSRKVSLITVMKTWVKDRMVHDTTNHLFLVFIPLFLNILVGVPLGIVAAMRPKIGRFLLSATGVMQTIPSLALLVFMIPFLGIGYPPALCALFLYGLLPILRNTYTGLKTISPNLLESANALGLPRWQKLLKIELPLASRHIFSGIKISAVINVGTATLGAIIGAGGYGEPIMIGIRRDDINLVLQGAIPAALLAIVIQALFDLAERHVVPRGLTIRPGE
jgi:osmoprotectant transport system permease protein